MAIKNKYSRNEHTVEASSELELRNHFGAVITTLVAHSTFKINNNNVTCIGAYRIYHSFLINVIDVTTHNYSGLEEATSGVTFRGKVEALGIIYSLSLQLVDLLVISMDFTLQIGYKEYDMRNFFGIKLKNPIIFLKKQLKNCMSVKK